MIDSIRTHSQAHGSPYDGPEFPVKGHVLPPDYWEVVRAADGFVTHHGFFRFFSASSEGPQGIRFRNASPSVDAYGALLEGFVVIAEDIFGDMYGYSADETGAPRLSKFYCEGGEIESCEPSGLPAFLARRLFVQQPDAFDLALASEALGSGIVPGLDEHLAFTLPLIAGGEYDVENLAVESTELHLGLLGQMSLAHSELPDGTPISGFTDDPSSVPGR